MITARFKYTTKNVIYCSQWSSTITNPECFTYKAITFKKYNIWLVVYTLQNPILIFNCNIQKQSWSDLIFFHVFVSDGASGWGGEEHPPELRGVQASRLQKLHHLSVGPGEDNGWSGRGTSLCRHQSLNLFSWLKSLILKEIIFQHLNMC